MTGEKLGNFVDKNGDNPILILGLMPIILVIGFPLLIIHSFIDHVWFCNVLGWHKAPKEQGFDGCSSNGICPVCGKKVLQDSQGNWF